MSSEQSTHLADFATATLLVGDYDGTMFDTFEPGPTGVGVNEAYKLAIKEVFDFDEGAAKRYESEGGHGNRTPEEIVHSLAPNASASGLKRLSRKLVEVKLSHLLDSIGGSAENGTLWPRPMPGFVETWQAISEARERNQPISTGVISAGHTEFIIKSFKNVGLDPPDFMVTDETIQSMHSALPLADRTKPSILTMDLIKAQWFRKYIESENERAELLATNPEERIVYLGDDNVKDRQLAKNSGVKFVLVGHETSEAAWAEASTVVKLGSMAVGGADCGTDR